MSWHWLRDAINAGEIAFVGSEGWENWWNRDLSRWNCKTKSHSGFFFSMSANSSKKFNFHLLWMKNWNRLVVCARRKGIFSRKSNKSCRKSSWFALERSSRYKYQPQVNREALKEEISINFKQLCKSEEKSKCEYERNILKSDEFYLLINFLLEIWNHFQALIEFAEHIPASDIEWNE